MTSAWEVLAGSIVLGWVFTYFPVLGRPIWLGYVLGAVAVGLTAVLGYQFGGVFMATFEPFGAMLPTLCIAQSLKRFGYITVAPISAVEKLVFALILGIVLMGTIGVIGLHPYPWFYTGWAPIFGVGLLSLWAYFRQQTPVLVGIVLAQAFWLFDIGSSNFFDQLSHFLLIPALVVSACLQAVNRSR